MKPHSYAKRRQVLEALAKGLSAADVAKECKVHISSVYAWKNGERKGRQPPISGRGSLNRGKHPEAFKANGHARDAIIYLRHARTAMIRQVVEEKDKLENPVYMFALMALNALEGRS